MRAIGLNTWPAERTAVVGLIVFSSVRGAMTLPFG
jgi:hypothetical protein